MNNKDKDLLSLLENADDRSIEKMAERYIAASEKDKERIYRISEKMYKRKSKINYNAEENTVSGVERYRRPKWYKTFASAAACFVLVGALAGAGVLIFKSTKNIVPATSNEEQTDTNTNTTEITEDVTETTTHPQFRELPLHEVYSADSIEEADKMAESHQLECSFNDRWGIDVEHYAEQLRNSDDLNTLENKSFIYHMMLNSVDYVETMQGHYTDDDEEVYFKYDLKNMSFYNKTVFSNGFENESYIIDNQNYLLQKNRDNQPFYQTYTAVPYETVYSYPDDNYRKILVDSKQVLENGWDGSFDGEYLRKNDARLRYSGCLDNSESYAIDKLYDFDRWHIDRIEDFHGRECAVLCGTYTHNIRKEDIEFTIYVDISTGILMYYNYADDLQADYKYEMVIDSLETNTDIDISLPDLSGYKRMKNILCKNSIELIPFDELYYPVNENGMTYGKMEDAANAEYTVAEYNETLNYLPDLIKVTGDNGIEGYVDSELCVYNSKQYTNNPVDDEWLQESSGANNVLTVYAVDGVTKVDTLTLVKK